MQHLMHLISTKNKDLPNISILITPKYHCEIAGEGIEYDWAITKKFYQNIPLPDKVTKEKFHQCFRDSINAVSIKNSQLFSAKARKYMLTYLNLEPKKVTYDNIERFVKNLSSHHNVYKQDTSYIDKLWRNTVGFTAPVVFV